MLLQETKDYVNNELLPDYVNNELFPGQTNEVRTGKYIALDTLDNIDSIDYEDALIKPTKVAKNILQNQDEFTDYVVEAFKDIED